MPRKTRPAHCAPGSITNARELGEWLRLSRERLASSDLATIGRAWRLWAACVDATVGYSRGADQTYAGTLARAAGIDRWATGDLLRQFDELGVFVWKAAPQGTRAMSELGLPNLHTRLPRLVSELHEAPTPHVEHATCGARTSLQSNTQDIGIAESSESHSYDRSSVGNPRDFEEESPRGLGEIGTPMGGTPEDVPGSFQETLRGLSVDELQAGVAEYGATMGELYAEELERRNIAPRRRPAWLDL